VGKSLARTDTVGTFKLRHGFLITLVEMAPRGQLLKCHCRGERRQYDTSQGAVVLKMHGITEWVKQE